MAKKRILKWIFLITISILMVMMLSALLAPNVLRCYFVSWSNLAVITNNVYADPDMPASKQEHLRMINLDAQERVANLFGEYHASPVIIAGHTMEVMELYGGNTYNQAGRTISSGVKTFIILGPDGLRDINILAHELAHAEFFDRIGYRKRSLVPNWFEEGLAVQVDDRISIDQWRLSTQDGKYAPDLENIGVIRHDDWLGYATAKFEVSRWLEIVGREGLIDLIEYVSDGSEFYSIYQDIEAAVIRAQ